VRESKKTIFDVLKRRFNNPEKAKGAKDLLDLILEMHKTGEKSQKMIEQVCSGTEVVFGIVSCVLTTCSDILSCMTQKL